MSGTSIASGDQARKVLMIRELTVIAQGTLSAAHAMAKVDVLREGGQAK